MVKIIFTESQLMKAISEEARTLSALEKTMDGLLRGHIVDSIGMKEARLLEDQIEHLKMSLAYKKDWLHDLSTKAPFLAQRLPIRVFTRSGFWYRRFSDAKLPRRLEALVSTS